VIQVTRGPHSKRGVSVSAALFLLASFITGLGAAGMPAASASSPSAATIAFDSIPAPLPGNVVSQAFEATQTSEFGDYATLANNPPNTRLENVDVVMSSWGCESGHWYSNDCATTSGTTFSHDITFTIYANPGNGSVGNSIASVTQTFPIPFRPSDDNINCPPTDGTGRWFDGTNCYHGLATTITFDFSSLNVTLPPSVIYGVSYNTTHYGSHPIGEGASCYTSSGGCGYDSLNVGAASTAPTTGTDNDQHGVFLNSSDSGSYCSGVAGTFRLDTPCWTGNPLVRFHVEAPDDPTNLAQTRPNASVIAPGGSTYGGVDRETVVLSADVSDPESSALVSLEVEVQSVTGSPIDTTQQSASTAPGSGGNLSVTVSGLRSNTNYQWRARAIDDNGFVSAWVNFGTWGGTGFDFRVPQADLSITKIVTGTSGLTPNTNVNIGDKLLINLTVINSGPDTAKNVTVTDDVFAIQDLTTAQHQVFSSATYCRLQMNNTCMGTPIALPSSGTFSAADLTPSTSASFRIFAVVSTDVREGPVTLTNTASTTSDVFDPNAANDQASTQFKINTIPKFDVQPGKNNAILSWSPPPPADEPPVDHYVLTISGSGTATVDPVPATPCTGRLGGTLCYNAIGLSNDVTYTFTLRAVTSSSSSRDGAEAQAKPSNSNFATIVPPQSTSLFSTCMTATSNTPICIQYSIPSGGGGVFSTQAITDAVAQCTALHGGDSTGCGTLAALGSFEGHPPAGYAASNPLMIQVTWDVTVAGSLSPLTPDVYYQLDGSAPKRLSACTKKGVAKPDPCLKAIKILGKSNDTTKTCKPQSACFGDIQVQILLSSNPIDGGIYHK
jgi:hypothetical protein